MQESYGTSPSGNLKEAVRGISNPAFLILMSNAEQFETHVAELEELYPGVPSIGCIGMSYQTSVTEKGVSVTAFEGVEAVTDVLEQASIMPVKYISRVEKALQKINASSENTVCIDFCTGNDAAVLTTMYSILEKKKISLTGGTGDGGKVSVNGTVYTDADVFAFVKNNGGKVRVYKENIYYPNPQYRFIASKTDRSKYTVGELNGKPARQAYQDTLGIREQDIVNQTFKNPLGKKNGKDICIISIKEVAEMVCAVICQTMIPMYFICLRQMIILLLSKKQCDRSKEISEEFPVFFHKLYFRYLFSPRNVIWISI